MTAISFGQGQAIGTQFQNILETCRETVGNQLDKLADTVGRGARLDNLKNAPKNLNINLGKMLGNPSDAANIKTRLDNVAIKTRQLTNVIGHCVPETEGMPTSSRLEGLSGEALKAVVGEHPRESTSIQESLRANVERLNYFVNHRVLGKSEAELEGTRPTVAVVAARAERNADVDSKNSARRVETAKVLANFVGRVGLPAAVSGLGALVSSDEFKQHVAQIPERLNATAQTTAQQEQTQQDATDKETVQAQSAEEVQAESMAGQANAEAGHKTTVVAAKAESQIHKTRSFDSGVDAAVEATVQAQQAPMNVRKLASAPALVQVSNAPVASVPEAQVEAADVEATDVDAKAIEAKDIADTVLGDSSALSDVMTPVLDGERIVVDWSDVLAQGEFIPGEMVDLEPLLVGLPLEDFDDLEPMPKIADFSMLEAPATESRALEKSTPAPTPAPTPASIAPNKNYTDWITLAGRALSALTAAAFLYSCFTGRGGASTDLASGAANFTKFG